MAVQRIVNRWSQALLFECEAETVKEALVKAVASGASLSRASLSRASLSGASLSGASLSGASLSGADLSGADLYGANLYGANLSGANLYGADLSGADLSGANLSGANLSGADLSGANLYGADLSGANLSGVNLSGVNLSGAKIEWSSHAVVAEILRVAAGNDIEKLKVAGLILIQRSWCWNNFCRIRDPLSGWAIDTLAPFVREDDEAPAILRDRAKTLAAAKASTVASTPAPVAEASTL